MKLTPQRPFRDDLLVSQNPFEPFNCRESRTICRTSDFRTSSGWTSGLCAGLVAFMGIVGLCQAEPDPLIVPNGNFEMDNSGAAEVWEGPWGEEVAVVSEDGNKFVRFKQEDGKMRVIKQFIPIDPTWEQIRISARMRCLDFKRGEVDWQDFRVMYEFIGVDGAEVPGWTGNYPRLTESSDWKEFVASGTIPVGAVSLTLFPGLFFANGQADLDDVEITVLTRREVPQATPAP